MSREAHVQFCESLGVRFPGATHLTGTVDQELLLRNEGNNILRKMAGDGGFSR